MPPLRNKWKWRMRKKKNPSWDFLVLWKVVSWLRNDRETSTWREYVPQGGGEGTAWLWRKGRLQDGEKHRGYHLLLWVSLKQGSPQRIKLWMLHHGEQGVTKGCWDPKKWEITRILGYISRRNSEFEGVFPREYLSLSSVLSVLLLRSAEVRLGADSKGPTRAGWGAGDFRFRDNQQHLPAHREGTLLLLEVEVSSFMGLKEPIHLSP